MGHDRRARRTKSSRPKGPPARSICVCVCIWISNLCVLKYKEIRCSWDGALRGIKQLSAFVTIFLACQPPIRHSLSWNLFSQLFLNFFVQAIHQFLTMHQIWRQPTAGNGHYMVHLNENLNESVISANLYVMISVIPVFHISHWLWHFPWKSVEPWKRWNCLSDQVFDQVFVQITNCICPNAEMYLSCTAWVVGNLGSTGWWRPKRGSNRIYDLRPRQPATLHPLFFSSKRSFQTSFWAKENISATRSALGSSWDGRLWSPTDNCFLFENAEKCVHTNKKINIRTDANEKERCVGCDRCATTNLSWGFTLEGGHLTDLEQSVLHFILV